MRRRRLGMSSRMAHTRQKMMTRVVDTDVEKTGKNIAAEGSGVRNRAGTDVEGLMAATNGGRATATRSSWTPRQGAAGGRNLQVLD